MTPSEIRTDVGEPSRMRAARSRAPSRALPAGVMWLTRPQLLASWAVTRRPVRIISVATFGGMVRGSRTTPPAPAMGPTLTSLGANWAASSATTRWQARAISQPPPIAYPLTAAITGFVIARRLVSPANPFFGVHIGLPDAE